MIEGGLPQEKRIFLEQNFVGNFYHHFIGLHALSSMGPFSGRFVFPYENNRRCLRDQYIWVFISIVIRVRVT